MEKQNIESEDDFLTMQQEAIRRVREMQSRARATLENAGMHIENTEQPDVSHATAKAGHTQPAEPIATPHTSPSQSSQSSQRKDAVHNDTGRNDAGRNDAQRIVAQHYNASHADTNRSDTVRSNNERAGTSHFSPQHENQRPTEKHSPHQEEPPVIHAPGLNIDIESDQLMLLVTLYLLIKDGADKWLILALAYIMLT